MKERFLAYLSFLFLGIIAFVPVAEGQHGHPGGAKEETMKMETKEVLVEGIKITFMVMANEEHKKMIKDMKMKEEVEKGTTHNITLTLKDQHGQDISNAQINMKVIDPKGKEQIKPLKYKEAMKSYDNYFNLKEKGKYQILVLIKGGKEKKRAGIYYEIN